MFEGRIKSPPPSNASRPGPHSPRWLVGGA